MTRRHLMLVAAAIGLILVGGLGWWLASPLFLNQQVDDAFPFEPSSETEATTADGWLIAAQGAFMDGDSLHLGSGSATIFQQGEQRVLRFEEFSVTNGPDLHVMLSTNPAPTGQSDIGGDHIDLGPLKGNQGDQNYPIPDELDLSDYQSVVIYCVPFHVVFATATIR